MYSNPLSHVSPESVGIPSGAISKMIAYLEGFRLPLHSLIILRHGKIAHECYWAPFHSERKHRMYSVSKSWVSLAIGLMADEGKLSLDDAVADYFPEYLPDHPHQYILRATIRDMLRMTDCHDETTYGFADDNWVKTWFETPPTHPAGTIFYYNTACTNVCCAIVEKIADMPFIDYLYPRLLTPIGAAEGIRCIQSPEGYSFGGSGVLCTPLDLARVAQLCLNGGKWEGKQLISKAYISEATSRQVDNTLTSSGSNDRYGYGYQFWRTKANGFACYGMGSQYAFCLPDYDMAVVITGDTQGIVTAAHIIFESIFDGLVPAVADTALPENAPELDKVHNLSASLSLPVVPGMPTSPAVVQANGATYHFGDTPLNIRPARFDFNGDKVCMTYTKPNGTHKLTFGIGKLVSQPFPETHYSGARIGVPAGRGYETYAGAAWADDSTLLAKASITDDYLGSFNMNATFKGDELTLFMTKDAEDFLHDYQGFAAGKI
jgi:CubicO group peptidase (beta-lactamase class C family)